MTENVSLFEYEVDAGMTQEMTAAGRCMKYYGITAIALVVVATGVIFSLWARYLVLLLEMGSVLAFVGTVLLVLLIVVGVLVFFVMRGGSRLQRALLERDQHLFNSGLRDIRTFFAIFGVVSLLRIVFVFLTFFK